MLGIALNDRTKAAVGPARREDAVQPHTTMSALIRAEAEAGPQAQKGSMSQQVALTPLCGPAVFVRPSALDSSRPAASTLAFGLGARITPPALQPACGMPAASSPHLCSPSSSGDDMDCSSTASDGVTDMLDGGGSCAPMAAALRPLPHVPRLQMDKVHNVCRSKDVRSAPAAQTQGAPVAQQTHCLEAASAATASKWTASRLPGALPASGATESARVDGAAVAPANVRPLERTVSDPGDLQSARIAASMPTFRDYLGHALSDAAPGSSGPPSGGALPTSITPHATMLTFRDLLHNSVEARPAAATPAAAQGESRPMLCPDTQTSSTTPECSSVGGTEAPPSTAEGSKGKSSPATSAAASSSEPRDLITSLCDVSAADEPASPCMSCTPTETVTATDAPGHGMQPRRLALAPLGGPRWAPGSVLSQNGGVLEAPSSPSADSPMSPPSMTPPVVADAAPPPPQRVRALEPLVLPAGASPQDDKENQAGNAQAQHQPRTALGQLTNKRLVPPADMQPRRHYAQDGAVKAVTTTATVAHEQDASDTSAWRAQHFRKLTDGSYFSDELIREAMAASQQVPRLGARPLRRRSFYSAPGPGPSRLSLPQTDELRSASAPPGPEAGALHLTAQLPRRPGSALLLQGRLPAYEGGPALESIAEPPQEAPESPVSEALEGAAAPANSPHADPAMCALKPSCMSGLQVLNTCVHD